MSSPTGWPGQIGQEDTFALEESTGWDEGASAEVVIKSLFGVDPMPAFIWLPDPARVEESVIYKTKITRFESQKEQRRVKGASRRRWRLWFRKGQTDVDAIWSFYAARKGPYEPFWWTNPIDDTVYWVRFADLMTRRTLWLAAFETGIELVEVR